MANWDALGGTTTFNSGLPTSKWDLLDNNTKDKEEEKDQSIGKNNVFPDGAFEIGSDTDGSIKYSFDTIYDDENLIKIAKEYYGERDGDVFKNNKDVIDEFISDRTWKQAHTLSMAGELKYVMDDDTSGEQKQRLAYLTDYWSRLPNFYAEGGRGWAKGLSSNIMAGMADPLNYVGGFIGGQVVKQGIKTAGKEIIKKSVQKEILKKSVIKGTGLTVAADATIFGGADALIQNTEKEIGLRDEYDISRTGYAAVIGAGTTILPSALGSYFVGKRALNKTLNPENELYTPTGDPVLDKATKDRVSIKTKKDTPFDVDEQGPSISDRANKAKAWAFDAYNPYRILQEKITGVKGSVEGLKTAYKNLKSKGVDPVTNPYFMFRMLVGSSTRADDFAKNGVKIMSDINAKEFKYTATGNKGLLNIVQDYAKAGHIESIFSYVAALRSNKIRSNAIKKPVGKERNNYLKNAMFTKEQADKWIDFAELSPTAYSKKYNIPLNKINKPELNFTKGAKDIKKYFDDLLKYQLKAGIIDKNQFKAIQNDHPFYIPFYTNGKITKEIGTNASLHSSAISKSVVGVGAPGAKKGMAKTGVAKTQAEYKPLFESSLDYTFSSVSAADKNVAKSSFYRMIDDGIKKGVIEEGEVVQELTGKPLLNLQKVATQSAIKKLEDMGVKINKEGIDELDSSFTTMSFADNILAKADAIKKGMPPKEAAKLADDLKIDIFYDKGKFRAFIIKDEGLKSLYQTYDTKWTAMWDRINKFTQPFARIPSTMITHSPPFIAFNFIRDTLSGSVNSAFGFKPFYTTIRGGLRTMKGPGKASNVKEYIQMYKRSDEYRRALVAGMGYTTRSQTEKFLNLSALNNHGNSPAVGYYKKSLRFLHSFYATTGLKAGAEGWQGFVSRVEYATRLGEFELAKAQGFSDVGAAFAGREVATDFAMRGNSKFLNFWSRNTLFFNAGLQGFYRGTRRARENPVKFGLAVGMGVVLPELMLWSINNQRREYEEVPDEVKQLNYLIPIFEDEKADGSHKWPNGQRRIKFFFPIPKPYDFGVFANVTIGIIEGVQEASPGIGFNYIMKSLNQIMPGSGIFRGGGGFQFGSLTIPILEEPAIIRPWTDLSHNHDWVGSKITPYGLEKVAPHLRVKTNTRESVIKFAQFVNKYTSGESNISVLNGIPILNKLTNPIELDYIVNSYMTGILSYPLDILDASQTFGFDEDRFGERVYTRGDQADITRKPWSIVTKRFKVEVPVKASQNIRTLYKIKEKADSVVAGDFEIKNSLRFLLDTVGLEENFSSEKLNQFRMVSGFLEESLTILAQSREMRDNIRFMKNLSGEEKLAQIEELRMAENEIAYGVLLALANADLDKVMENTFGGNKYNVPKEDEYSDPLNLRKIFGVE